MIQTSTGSANSRGDWPTKRSGWAAEAGRVLAGDRADDAGVGDNRPGSDEVVTVDFHTDITVRDWHRKVRETDLPCDDPERFYGQMLHEVLASGSSQFYGQVLNERDWERKRRPYYNLYPAIVPMLTRLNLDLDSSLIRLPLPVLCVRLAKDAAKNPLKFDWKGDEIPIRCMLVGEINEGKAPSILIDIGEVMIRPVVEHLQRIHHPYLVYASWSKAG